MTDQLPEEERLRIERSEFLISLGTLPQDDPRRQPLNRKLRENTEQLRQLIVDRAMDPMCAAGLHRRGHCDAWREAVVFASCSTQSLDSELASPRSVSEMGILRQLTDHYPLPVCFPRRASTRCCASCQRRSPSAFNSSLLGLQPCSRSCWCSFSTLARAAAFSSLFLSAPRGRHVSVFSIALAILRNSACNLFQTEQIMTVRWHVSWGYDNTITMVGMNVRLFMPRFGVGCHFL